MYYHVDVPLDKSKILVMKKNDGKISSMIANAAEKRRLQEKKEREKRKHDNEVFCQRLEGAKNMMQRGMTSAHKFVSQAHAEFCRRKGL